MPRQLFTWAKAVLNLRAAEDFPLRAIHSLVWTNEYQCQNNTVPKHLVLVPFGHILDHENPFQNEDIVQFIRNCFHSQIHDPRSGNGSDHQVVSSDSISKPGPAWRVLVTPVVQACLPLESFGYRRLWLTHIPRKVAPFLQFLELPVVRRNAHSHLGSLSARHIWYTNPGEFNRARLPKTVQKS